MSLMGEVIHQVNHPPTHCKTTWVTSTTFWSSQLHTCCVRDMLQTSKDASNLIQIVVEKLLYFIRLGSSCRRPINQHFW